MKLILMSKPDFFVEEHQILNALFEEGLDILHIRKPYSEPVYSERLLSLIPEEYRKRIVVHDHFYLNPRNLEIPSKYKGHISFSCHDFDEVKEHKKKCDYVFLSPIFDSISKAGYKSNFTHQELLEQSKKKVIDKKVIALGGVDLDNIPKLKDYGFGGVVLMGSFWNRFDLHSTQDFKDLINHFRKAKKIIDKIQ